MTTPDPAIDRLRHDRAALEAEIIGTGSAIKNNQCNCPHPQHDDGHPSADIKANEQGVWRVRCHSRDCFGKGADIFDLRATLTGRPVADLLREARGTAAPPARREPPQESRKASPAPDMTSIAKAAYATCTIEQRQSLADELGVSVDALDRLRCGWLADQQAYTFPMRDAAGRVIGVRTRFADNSKRAVTGSSNGLFIPADLETDGTFFVAEGPSDVAAMLDMGAPTIGRPSNNAGEDLIVGYIERHDPQAVVIVIDRDADADTAAKTRQAAERLAQRLVPLVGDVRIVQPPEGFKDVRAWRNAGAGQDDLDALVDAAPSLGPAGELRAMFAAEIDGTRSAIAWPWKLVGRGTQALLPGTVTLWVGDPGSGKSLCQMESLAHWHDAGIAVSSFELEGPRKEHLRRALAQRVGAGWLTDLEAVRARPNEVMAYQAEHAGWLDRFGRCIHVADDKPVTLNELLRWITERAMQGDRIIAIDPITKAKMSDRPWQDAQDFLHAALPVLDRYGASLILVTHPKTSSATRRGPRTLDDLAGGAAWTRFSQTVIWLEKYDEPKSVNVKNFGDAFPLASEEEVNRCLRIMKARNGRGTGWQIAIDFDPQTLRFYERGVIVKNQSREVAQ